MITALREATKSLWMWIILGVLALGFGLSFGLPSDAISLGQDPIVKVYGEPVRPHDYNYQWAAFNVTNYIRIPKQDKRMQEMMGLKEEVLDAVIERRVLAKAGEEMGLHVDIADAEDLTFEGHIIILGDTIDWLGGRKFNYERLFKGGLLQTLQSNERDYLERQRREIMARTVRDLVASTAVIPEAELRKEYESRANRVSLRYVRFQSAFYADLVDPTPEEIDAYVKEHRDELSKQFESQGVRFTKLPKQVRLRFIKVEKPSAPEVEEGATVEPAAQKAHDEAVAAARAKIEAAIAQLDEGKDFRQVAREVSQDATTGRRGGDYGWVSLEGTGTGLEAIVDETAAKLEPGQVSAVVESDAAFYLIKIDGAREGDVAEDEALRELAEEALMTAGGKTLAKQAAEEALLKVREERKPLAELFDDKDALGADSPGIDSLPIDELGESATGLDAMRPKISVTGLFGKGEPIRNIGVHPELTKAAWEGDAKAEIIDELFTTDDGFVIAGVERREVATDEGFAEQRAALYRELALARARQRISLFARDRCLVARAKGSIAPVEDKVRRLITYDTNLNVDEEGKVQMRPYQVCDRVGMRGGLFRLGGMGALMQAGEAGY